MWRPPRLLVVLILATHPFGSLIAAEKVISRGSPTLQAPPDVEHAVATPTTAAPGAESVVAGEPRCRIQVRSLQVPRGQRFSATEILDLDFRALFRGDFSGEHQLQFKIYTPNQHLYQTLTVPFSTSAARGGALRQVDGFPRPLTVQATGQVETAAGPRHVVTARLPVAGTTIVHSSLYGRWRVEAHFDDSVVSCSRRPRVFRITQ